jgi:putative Mg2+ transporter-C (MgtC) family protein
MTWESIATDVRPEILLRIALTTLAGFVLGVERERHGRAAGLRTTLLVSLSACVAMIVSDSFYIDSLKDTAGGSWHPDPARLAAGVLTGMGFLGAGVIIRQTNYLVRGVTTAATMWFSTVMGLAFGSGAIGIGVISSVIVFIILFFLPKIEKHIKDDWYSDLTVQLDGQDGSIESIVGELKALEFRVKGVDLESDHQRGSRRVTFHLKYKKGDLVRIPLEITDRIGRLPGVQMTHWQA